MTLDLYSETGGDDRINGKTQISKKTSARFRLLFPCEQEPIKYKHISLGP